MKMEMKFSFGSRNLTRPMNLLAGEEIYLRKALTWLLIEFIHNQMLDVTL